MPDEFEIELDLIKDPETKEKIDKAAPKDGGEGGSKAVSAEDLLDLQRELEAAKADRDAAKRGEHAATAKVAEVERTSSEKIVLEVTARIAEQETTVETALASAQSEIESCRTLAAKAMEEGKWQEAAEANENLTDAKVRFRELTHQKGQLAASKERIKAEAAKPKAPAVGNRTQSWIAAHPRFNSDSVYRAKALLAHEEAVRDGLSPESDEYFERVELATGDRKAKVEKTVEKDDDKDDLGEGGRGKSPTGGEPRQSGAAPVTRRASPTPSAGGKQVIKLSGEQVEAADSLFGDPTNTTLYIKDPKERYTYWHTQQARLKEEGRI